MNYIHELQKTLGSIDPSPLIPFIRACQGTLWLAGNGGSASTAQHWACDLSKAAGRRVQALGSNPALLTAWANDEDYEDALAMEFSRTARPGDAVICISCSGGSRNIQQLINAAYRIDVRVAMVTSTLCGELHYPTALIRVPHTHYGIIEDCHLAIGHWLTEELRDG